ncbi:HlyD family efflux transporter periplasmic adaptor subunit [Pseudomonas neustonica]|uniref:HlyD family efflux transporter periplasmic adaptor subunit n=2 Tax=Pseudomonas TaxID=286 RepID=A0ABX9XIB1_9PSED|nr:HlyD family efflux transporter periplasmic adaptor subunit [Pseudomonas sp. SSM44]ROZ84884.1 HlyD family efflux transporter periplasmic adaptor subunit [Pseudomonas neustonica]|tara:strand:- start:6993 stop:8306 length:1314 start_codon:yes stop_codon:yes gene_type:complete
MHWQQAIQGYKKILPFGTPMRKRLVPILIVATGIAIFILLRLTGDDPAPVNSQERSWRVATEVIQPDAFAPRLTLYGQLESPLLFTVVAPMAGRIASLPAKDGEQIKQGELLMALDEADIQPRVEQAKADLEDAKAQLQSEKIAHQNDLQALRLEQRIQANAQKNLERTEQLIERGVLPTAELENSKDALDRSALTVAIRQRSINSFASRLQALEARVARAQATFDSTLRDAERSRFLAPFDGVVGNVQAAVGDQVNVNAALLDFYPLQGMELRAVVPQVHSQSFSQALQNGQQLKARSLDVEPPIHLTLKRIAGQADARGVEALFSVDQPQPGLRLGNLLAISVARPVRNDSVALPYSALYGNDTLYQVLDGRLQRIQVQRVGETMNEQGERRVLVRSTELKAGMEVVTTHLPNAVQGLKVEASAPATKDATGQQP